MVPKPLENTGGLFCPARVFHADDPIHSPSRARQEDQPC